MSADPVPPASPSSASPRTPVDVVAIDGPSGAGKSTVAKRVAERLGFDFLDTGAMYRAVTWHFLEKSCAPAETAGDRDGGEATMRDVLARMRLELRAGRLLVNGKDVTPHLRTREVDSQVSGVSALPFVRAAMRDLQRQVALRGPVVAEGRDMGSVVFPNARWKVYLDAAPQERARRRHRDFESQGRAVSEAEVLDEIEVRDHLDSSRKDAPLVQPVDAAYVDTTGMTTEAVVEAVLAVVRARGGPAKSPR